VDPAVSESLPSVLVVDDERGPRESLKLVLKSQFEVLTADSAEQAMEIIRTRPIDVVTLDLKMPGASGPRALSAIKALDPEIEVVVVTGYGSLESVIEVLKLRAFDYIAKPFDAAEVVHAVRQAAASRRRRTNARRAERWVGSVDEIVHEVEHWRDEAVPHLNDPDRDALERILARLQTLRARIHPDGGGTH
jgi:DNA-binding NtrC family response regulator